MGGRRVSDMYRRIDGAATDTTKKKKNPSGTFFDTDTGRVRNDPKNLPPKERALLWSALEVMSGCTDKDCKGKHTREVAAALGLVDQPKWKASSKSASRRVRLDG